MLLTRAKTGAAKLPSKATNSSIRSDIQGLRALAVMAVIFDHLFGWPSGGFVGVDVFFVISGFLITGLLLREHKRTGRISFVDFYRRRVKRIMPVALVVVVATLFAAYFLFSSDRFGETLADGFWATFFAANWHFAAAGTDYFQLGGPVSPLQHYWSLAVEEQFYFVWPWVMLAIFSLVARGSHGTERRARVLIGVTIVVLSAISFMWAIWETLNNPTWAYFSTFSRAWELGIGAMVAIGAARLSRIPQGWRPILGWVGLLGITASLFVVSDENLFPAPWAALPVISTALVIAAGTGGPQRFLWPLMNRTTNHIGDLSYSLYLWHFPVLVLLLTLMPGDNWGYYVSALLVTAFLSVSSYHLIENPIRKSRWLTSKSKRERGPVLVDRKVAIGWVGLASVVSLVLVLAAVQSQRAPVPVTDPNKALYAYSSDATSSVSAQPVCRGAATLDSTADCSPDTSAKLSPSPDDLSSDTGNSYKCFPKEDEPMKSCSYGDSNSATKVAIVGDSHAASLLPGLSEQASSQGWALDTYVGAACIWIEDSCAAMPAIQDALVSGGYDIVITSAYRGSGDTDKRKLAEKYAAAWQPVANSGSKIIVVADVPGSVGDAVSCTTRANFNPAVDNCAIEASKAFRVQDASAMAVPLVSGAKLVETRQYFCTDTCPQVIGGVLVYRDDISHISATYSKTLGPYIARDISLALAG